MERHMSMRGEIIDFNKLRLDHADQIPLGNAPVNAKGDLINEEGIVLKTEEQLESEYQARLAENNNPPRTVDIKSKEAINSVVSSPDNAVPIAKQLDVDDANFEPVIESVPTTAQPKARRKIVESED